MSELERMRALASELGAELTADELNAVIMRHQNSLPVHSPTSGYTPAPRTAYYKAPAKTREKTYREKMEEGSAALSNAIAEARSGRLPSTPSGLMGSWKTGVNASNWSGAGSDHETRSEPPQPLDRDPCVKCGVRADIGCECG